ncbi:hypothetical protein CCMA1212_001164 [Trichoderma ghanense]|uniref:Uncharacterized protein n=1 Tax=Trichoderma ghanense TaxID=65468 RepID=A0ABY2HFR2_9HYPO
MFTSTWVCITRNKHQGVQERASALIIKDIPSHLTQEQVAAIRQKYRHYQRGYNGDDKLKSTLTKEEILASCKELTEGVFKLAGIKPDQYKECFKACVDTKVLAVKNWSSWGGYRRFSELVKDAAEYTQETHKVHLPNAPADGTIDLAAQFPR